MSGGMDTKSKMDLHLTCSRAFVSSSSSWSKRVMIWSSAFLASCLVKLMFMGSNKRYLCLCGLVLVKKYFDLGTRSRAVLKGIRWRNIVLLGNTGLKGLCRSARWRKILLLYKIGSKGLCSTVRWRNMVGWASTRFTGLRNVLLWRNKNGLVDVVNEVTSWMALLSINGNVWYWWPWWLLIDCDWKWREVQDV